MQVRRYRGEIAIALAAICMLGCFAVAQHIVRAEPPQQAGATASCFLKFIGVPLDDVFIHARFADNVFHGNGYGLNSGKPVTADTSPLWVALLVLCRTVTSDLPTAAVLLSALAYIALCIGVYRASRDLFRLEPRFALLAGLLTVVASRLVWAGMSGMETSLAALLMFLMVEEHERSRQRGRIRPREALWLGLGILTRPEFYFVAAVVSIDWLLLFRQQKIDGAKLWPTIVVAAIIASPALLLPLVIDRSLVTHSSVVQGAGLHFIPNVAYLWFVAKILASNNVVIFLLIAVTLVPLVRMRQYRVLLIIAVGLPVLQAFVAPQFRHHGRYFFPVIPLLIVAGVAALQHWKERGAFSNRSLAVAGIALALAGAVETGRWAVLEAESVRNINDQHLAAVNLLRGYMTQGDTLAADDVGAVSYFLNKPIIDLTGLVSPEIWRLKADQNQVWGQARKEGANLFLIYDRLNPPFYQSHKDSLELVRDFRVRLPLVSAADTVMSLYRTKHAD